jgi:putative Mg2+ transporter-C (MgtC) family protein
MLWCSDMVGTLAGAGLLGPSVLAAAFVIVTNLFLRPLVRRLNTRSLTATDAETYYTVEIACHGAEEAHMRSLLLQALTHAGLGLRRLDSGDIPDTSKVTVTAQAVAAKRNNAALEQIVGRLSLEPNVSAATWQIDRSIPEA